jgi:hypothetical protein
MSALPSSNPCEVPHPLIDAPSYDRFRLKLDDGRNALWLEPGLEPEPAYSTSPR